MDQFSSSLLSSAAPLSANLTTNLQAQLNAQSASTIKGLKYYFDVSNGYVVRKIGVVLFPWRKGTWGRMVVRGENGTVEGYRSPRADENAPDLYVPSEFGEAKRAGK